MELKKDWSCELSRSNIYCSKTAEVITPFLLGKNGVNDSFRLKLQIYHKYKGSHGVWGPSCKCCPNIQLDWA